MNFDIFSNLFSNIWSIFLVIIFFGGSIFIHELGHFLAAKRRGLKIECFSIGFGPKLFAWNRDGIEYRISLLPLGGYVALPQIAGMIAIEGKSKAVALPEISYFSKVLVASMGAIFNLIFAFILAAILWGLGQPSSYEQQTTTVGYVAKNLHLDFDNEVPGPAHIEGIRPGDKILEVDGTPVHNFQDIQQLVVTGSGRTVDVKPQAILTVEREDKTLHIPIQPQLVQYNTASDDRLRAIGVSPAQMLVVGDIMKNSPAEAAGLQQDDKLIAVNGDPLYSLNTLIETLKRNQSVHLTIERKNEILTVPLIAEAVPFTKPIVQLTTVFGDQQAGSLQLLPLYPKEIFNNLTDLNNPATLLVFDSSIPMIRQGDTLQSINNDKVNSLSNFISIVSQNAPKTLQFNFDREGSEYTISLQSPFSATLVPPKTQSIIGIQLERIPLIIHVDPVTQFRENIVITFRTLGSLLHKGSNISVQNLMGPPGILRTLHTFSSQDFRLLLWLVILLNINLAILNLLPIPVLDGGHILFFTIAKLRGKALPSRFIASLQAAFMLLLFGLMIYVSFFDIRRWQGDSELERKVKIQSALYISTEFPG